MRNVPLLIFLAGFCAGCVSGELPANKAQGVENWPTTCRGAVEKLAAEMPQTEKAKLAKMAQEDLILLHHGFGTGIRNEFGLWGGNLALVENCAGSRSAHPDDVSMIIIERFWQSLQ